MHILVTRPIAQALTTKQRLEAFGHEVSLAPMLEIVFPVCPDIDPDVYQAIAVTSANAIDGLLQRPDIEGLRALPLFAVGDNTAQRAEWFGWESVRSAAGNADDLARLIASTVSGDKGRVLYAAGSERTGDLEGKLEAGGFMVDVAEVYQARPVERLPEAIVEMLQGGQVDAVFVYSARSAQIFLDCIRELGMLEALADTRVCTLSEAIAAPFRQAGFDDLTIAHEPNEISLFKLLQLQG